MDNNQKTRKLLDIEEMDVNEINVSSVEDNEPIEIKTDENGFFNNLDDFEFEPKLNIKIIGVGGAGNNMIEHLANNSNLDPKMLYAVNTDYQVLKKMQNLPCSKIFIGRKTTNGYGSGSDPLVGKKAVDEDRRVITNILKGVDLLFIVSGMGKGTGTGASPIIAQIARELNILTISIVNVPSVQTEGQTIFDKGAIGVSNLKKYVDGLATINNDKILGADIQNESLFNCFRKVNQVISETITDLINTVNIPSNINIDFNDIKNFFKNKTHFQITNCEFESNENSKEVLKQRICSTLFEDKIIGSQKAILTLKLNPDVPSTFVSDIRKVIEELTENPNIELTYSVDYSSDISFAKASILIATNYFKADNILESSLEDQKNKMSEEDILIQKTNELNYINELEQKIQSIENKENISDEILMNNYQPIEENVVDNNIVNEEKNNEEVVETKSEQQVEEKTNCKSFNNREEMMDKILDDITKMEVNINNNNPNSSNYNQSYHLDEIESFNKDYGSLKEELTATKNMLNQKSRTKRLSEKLVTNQQSISSTKLNQFISKTLVLFKKETYNNENGNR